ncbi:MAG: hypothetical protein ACK4NX_02595, partial [Candidatus Paceibacteria bacterium]
DAFGSAWVDPSKETLKSFFIVTEDLEKKEKEEKEKQRFRLLLLERIDKYTKMQYPEALLEQEIDVMIAELKSQVAEMGLPWQDYLSEIGRREEALLSEFRERAQKRVRYALILEAIAKEENIEPTPEEIKEEMNRYLLRFSSPEEAEKNIDVLTLAKYTKGVLQNEKVFQYLEKIAG